jgi:hypothetical protein
MSRADWCNSFYLQGKDEFLGRARAEPVVRVNGSEGGPARLAWYTIETDGGYGGDILAAFELFLVSRDNAILYYNGVTVI